MLRSTSFPVPRFLPLLLLSLFVFATAAAAQDYVPEDSAWDHRFGRAGVTGEVKTLLRVGDSLIIGGNFSKQIGRDLVHDLVILRLSDSSWIDPGLTLGGSIPDIRTLGHDNTTGYLYAGGSFTEVNGDTSINYITVWDGAQWTSLSGGNDHLDNNVQTMHVRTTTSGPFIYIGGYFTTAGGLDAPGIALFHAADGWDNLNGQLYRSGGAFVLDIAYDYPNLYIGGSFTLADTLPVNNIAAYDIYDDRWTSLNGGPSNSGVQSVATFSPGISEWLIVGGNFSRVNDTLVVNNIARYDINSGEWSPFANGLGGSVLDIYCESRHPARIIVGGSLFSQLYSDTLRGLAEWNELEDEWQLVGNTRIEGKVNCIAPPASTFSQRIDIGGDFYTAGETVARGVARENSSGGWHGYGLGTSLNFGSSSGSLQDIATDGERLYMVGGFDAIGNLEANGLAIWDTLTWTIPPGNFDVPPRCVLGFGDTVYVGGFFTQIDGVPYNRIAMWDGSAWNPLGDGLNSYVNDMIRGIDGNLYVTGGFDMAGSDTAIGVAMWDGLQWHNPGADLATQFGSNGSGEHLCLDSTTGSIYVAGNFWTVAGIPSRCVARYSGGLWHSVGTNGVPTNYSSAQAVAVDASGRVYVAGDFGNDVWLFHGTGWDTLGLDICFEVETMLSDGCNVYLGGKNELYLPTGCFGNAVARFNGSSFLPIGSGIGVYPNEVRSMTIMNGNLYFAGGYQSAGSVGTAGLAVWRDLAAGSTYPLSLIAPASGDTLHYGTVFPIEFIADSVSKVQVEYSLDSGLTWTILHNRARPDKPLLWLIPDTNVAFCQVRIADGDAACYFTDGGFFTITADSALDATWMTRTGGTYYDEPYVQGYHNWPWPNDSANTWPESYYETLDYSTMPWPLSTIKRDDRFPDWWMFEDMWGKDWAWTRENPPRVVNPDAFLFWDILSSSGWNGSCYGFAVSAMLAWRHFSVTGDIYFEDLDYIHDRALSDFWRHHVNKYWSAQFGPKHLLYGLLHFDDTPMETLRIFRDSSFSKGQYPRVLSMLRLKLPESPFNWDGVFSQDAGGHTVVAYKVTNVPDSAGIYRMYVYDNNYPDDSSKFVRVDSTSNTWSYIPRPDTNISANFQDTCCGLYASLPISEFGGSPLDPAARSPQLPFAAQELGYATIYLSATEDILLTDSSGNQVGVVNGLFVNDSSLAYPIIPLQPDYPRPRPLGYFLPDRPYSVTLSQLVDSVRILHQAAETIYAYARAQCDTAETDRLALGAGLSVVTDDPAPKTATVIAVEGPPDNRRYYRLDNLNLEGGDSLHVEALADGSIFIGNAGTAKTYSMIFWNARSDGEDFGQIPTIVIDSGWNQWILPAWNNLLDSPLVVINDVNGDGSPDDTVYLNVATDITDDTDDLPLPGSFALRQNFPNPFNPSTTIEFSLPSRSRVRLVIYNILGREVMTLLDEDRAAGSHAVQWLGTDYSGSPVASGVYFYRLETDERSGTKKMLLLR